MNKVGIFGGSFNPVQVAHLVIADRFVEELDLDICYFVPANLSPFKTNTVSELFPAEQRIKMLQKAIKGNKRFAINTYEIDSGGISHTIDTIKHFRSLFPDDSLFMLIGSDHAANFQEWGEWESIIELVQLCIARRPYTVSDQDKDFITKNLTYDTKAPIWIEAPMLDISASEIRNRIKTGKSIKYIVPRKVEKYLIKSLKDHSE